MRMRIQTNTSSRFWLLWYKPRCTEWNLESDCESEAKGIGADDSYHWQQYKSHRHRSCKFYGFEEQGNSSNSVLPSTLCQLCDWQADSETPSLFLYRFHVEGPKIHQTTEKNAFSPFFFSEYIRFFSSISFAFFVNLHMHKMCASFCSVYLLAAFGWLLGRFVRKQRCNDGMKLNQHYAFTLFNVIQIELKNAKYFEIFQITKLPSFFAIVLPLIWPLLLKKNG